MYEELCNILESIIPNIRWDEEGCIAIKKAIEILKSQEDGLHSGEEKKLEKLNEKYNS